MDEQKQVRRYVIVVKGFDPATMPYDIFMKIVDQIPSLFALRDTKHLHFSEIKKGCCALYLDAEDETSDLIYNNLVRMRKGLGKMRQQQALSTLGVLLKNNNAQGRIDIVNDNDIQTVLEIPVHQSPEGSTEFKTNFTLQGRLISLGEIQAGSLRATIEPSLPSLSRLTSQVDSKLKERMKDCLFKNVRVRGKITKRLNADGTWQDLNCLIDECVGLKEMSFKNLISKLQAHTKNWPKNLPHELLKERHIQS